MNKATFFNVSAATLVSKWRGDSEKLVRCLFSMARHCAPSVVFLDELDALAASRGSGHEHEASRRMKTELLTQMDGVAGGTDANGGVMVLATTNHPWDLDEALRRRLEKRIYIPLPDAAARAAMFTNKLAGVHTAHGLPFDAFAEKTGGYSGADIHVVCREASMAPMRRLLSQKSPEDVLRLRRAGALHPPAVQEADVLAAIAGTKPSVAAADISRFDEWNGAFASV